jgi:WAS/WASL-interacting protein
LGCPSFVSARRLFAYTLPKVTTGSPLYLVSACGSAEEFVAAFRRYADRTGLFIPSAAPLPAGRKGRLALTLKDGGVMIEGEAEILQSSAKPTVLHGRPGMTVKFVEPDEPSKTVIGELEKARLAVKPAPPTVAPRPATIPTSPRPVVPAPSGRIDAANALAECVVIGDASALAVTASAPRSAFGPAIPAAPPRPKTPSTAPDPPKPPPMPQSTKATTLGLSALDRTPGKAEPASPATTLGTTSLDRKPGANVQSGLLSTQLGVDAPPNPTSPSMPAQTPLLETKLGYSSSSAGNAATAHKPTVHEETTSLGTAPPKPPPPAKPLIDPVGEDDATAVGAVPSKKTIDPMPAAAPKPTPLAIAAVAAPKPPPPPAPAHGAVAAENPRHESAKHHKATSIGFPVVRGVFETQPLGLVPPAPPSGRAEAVAPEPPALPKGRPAPPPARGKTPTTPPLTPRHPTPVAPVPIVRPPAKSAPAVPEETTDLSLAPTANSAPIEVPIVDGDAANKPPEPPTRSGGMRASEILAAIPAGDWTMSPDESTPHALPPEAKMLAQPPAQPTPAPAPAPKGPPTGDWLIQLDPDSGWSEPEKLAKAAQAASGVASAAPPAEPPSGNPVVAVSSDKPINVMEWDEKPTGIGEAKIEVDSTLMEPLQPMPLDDDEPAQIVDHKPGDFPLPPPPLAIPPTPGFHQPFPTTGGVPMYRHSATDMIAGYAPVTAHVGAQDPAKRKKMILLAIGAGAVAVGAIVILVLTLSGSKKPAPTGSGGTKQAVKVAPPAKTVDAAAEVEQSGSDNIVIEPGSGAETPVKTQTPEKPAPVDPGAVVKMPSTCSVELKSVPPGAEVYLGKQKLGATPGLFVLPCGAETKLSLRKKPYPDTQRAVKPTAEATSLTVKLQRPTFLVKVTSSPAGATITSRGKSLGVTPTTIKLPGFDATALTLTKPGFAVDTQRVKPTKNNTSHHVTLKKGKGR